MRNQNLEQEKIAAALKAVEEKMKNAKNQKEFDLLEKEMALLIEKMLLITAKKI